MNGKIAGVALALASLFALTALQLQAQTPAAAPKTTPTTGPNTEKSNSTSPAPTMTPSPLSSSRDAVLNSALDGDSFTLTFTDNGQDATVHLANVDAPDSVTAAECFGRAAADYAARIVRETPRVSVRTVGDLKDGELSAYLVTPEGYLLNEQIVKLGFGRFSDDVLTLFTEGIQASQEKAETEGAGLWRACAETEEPRPCYLFSGAGMDSASKRALHEAFPELSEIQVNLLNVSYDPVQHELIALWHIWADRASRGLRIREYYSLSDCLRIRSELFEHNRR